MQNGKKCLNFFAGEFEYNDTFKNEEGEKILENEWIRLVRLLFFSAFLISVPVAFFNLLTGSDFIYLYDYFGIGI